jgi:hypothetical protein
MLACNTPCACSGKYGVQYALYICVLFCALPVTWKAVTQAKPSTTMQCTDASETEPGSAVVYNAVHYSTVHQSAVQSSALYLLHVFSLR